jgi:pilus assembly protein Flp/PilA
MSQEQEHHRATYWIIRESIMNYIRRFTQNEEGVTAIEYGLIAALIAVVIIVAVRAVGTSLTAVYEFIAAALGAAI